MPSGAFAPPPDLAWQGAELPGPPPPDSAPHTTHEAFPDRDSAKRSPDRHNDAGQDAKLRKRGSAGSGGHAQSSDGLRGEIEDRAGSLPVWQAPAERPYPSRPPRRRSRTSVLLIKVRLTRQCAQLLVHCSCKQMHPSFGSPALRGFPALGALKNGSHACCAL